MYTYIHVYIYIYICIYVTIKGPLVKIKGPGNMTADNKSVSLIQLASLFAQQQGLTLSLLP